MADSAQNDSSTTAAKKTAGKKAAPRTAAKKTAPRTTAAKKTAPRTAAKKTATPTAAKTTAAKRTAPSTSAATPTAASTTAATKTAAKKTAPPKTAAKKTAPPKTAAEKAAPGKTAAKKVAPTKTAATTTAASRTAATRAAGPTASSKATPTGEDTEQLNPIQRLINWRVSAAMEPHPPNETVMKLQQPIADLLEKYYFRVEVDGWERVPDQTCLVIGVHSGGALTMDAWSLVNAWQKHFDGKRHLHGTAHDVLMASPGLGDYFRAVGVIAANKKSVGAALERGEDVVVWPGGEVDAMRSWFKRDVATLGGRTGFVKQAIRSGVPILPVATVGGHDTVFILNEGKWLANALDKVLGLKKTLRGANLPIIAGFPFPIAVEVLPAHVPLPAKIRTEFLEPIEVDTDPERANDAAYVQKIYNQVEAEIQAGMDRLAAKRRLPILG